MKQHKRHRTNFISNIIIIITVAAVGVLSFALYYHTTLEVRFDTLINWLNRVDKAIAALDSKTDIIICIFALFIAKCQLPIPMGILCIISGMVFPIEQAIIINVVFTMFVFLVKYIEGIWIGGGWAGMLLNINKKQMRFVRDWIKFKGNGNPYVLCVCRLVPAIPIGMVSKYYGSMKYDPVYYMLLSTIGFAPRLYVYTKIGVELFNPFSAKFITLLIIIVAFTGITALAFNIYYGKKSNQMTQTLLIYSQKEKYKIVL